jgi:hypothetical protein
MNFEIQIQEILEEANSFGLRNDVSDLSKFISDTFFIPILQATNEAFDILVSDNF